MSKRNLNYHDRLDRVWSMLKTRQDNNLTNYTGVVFAKNYIELLEPIGPDVV